MSKERILIVEDDESIRELLAMTLAASGYGDVVTAADGNEGLSEARACHPDLILLDLMLPYIDGLTICSVLKGDEATRHIPIIMITARNSEADIIKGLDMGANDYVTKPFSRQVLLARIRTQLRGYEEKLETEEYAYGGLVLNSALHSATLDGAGIELTAGEFTLLQLFLKHPGRVFTRSQIVAMTKGDNYPVTERAIDVQLVSLRRKLGALDSSIETVRGVGYRLKAEESE